MRFSRWAPQLTFALREGLFGLSAIEDELLGVDSSSRLPAICDEAMREDPGQWIKHYPENEPQASWRRQNSYSDRIRYYWNHPAVSRAVQQMFDNLSDIEIPPPLLSRYLPAQYRAARKGDLAPTPRKLVIHNILQVTSAYSRAGRNIA